MTIVVASNVDEFGPGSCTCFGVMTGCSVCTCANLLIAFGKKIPRLADGTPDMRTLGARMGARHRRAAAAVGEANYHGLSLVSGAHCGNGTWCAYCIVLELRAAGVNASYAGLSWAGIIERLERRQPMGVRGWYGRIHRVSSTSYDRTTPARGRSDSFLEWHMTTWWGLDGHGNVMVSDPDFGSSGRPVVPPYSLWPLDEARSYWAAGGSGVALVSAVPTGHVSIPSQPIAIAEDDMLKYTRATSPSSMRLAKGQRLYRGPGGPAITAMSRTASVPHLGLSSSRAKGHGWRLVVVSTGARAAGYKDGGAHRTGVYVPATAGVVSG